MRNLQTKLRYDEKNSLYSISVSILYPVFFPIVAP